VREDWRLGHGLVLEVGSARHARHQLARRAPLDAVGGEERVGAATEDQSDAVERRRLGGYSFEEPEPRVAGRRADVDGVEFDTAAAIDGDALRRYRCWDGRMAELDPPA
jgi:hypothetical protein